MPGMTISCSSLISSLSALDDVELQALRACGDVTLALGTDHAQLVVILPDVFGYVCGIPALFTTPRAKGLGHFIILHLSTP